MKIVVHDKYDVSIIRSGIFRSFRSRTDTLSKAELLLMVDQMDKKDKLIVHLELAEKEYKYPYGEVTFGTQVVFSTIAMGRKAELRTSDANYSKELEFGEIPQFIDNLEEIYVNPKEFGFEASSSV